MENDPVDAPATPIELSGAPPSPKARHAFVIGFIALLPLMLTFFVLSLAWQIIVRISGPLGMGINWVVSKTTTFSAPPEWVGTLAGVLLALLATYLMGLAIVNIFGPQLVRWTDALFSRLPVVRYIYPHAKQLSEFLFGARKLNFNRVVIVEYPRKGVWSIGFITGSGISAASRKVGMPLISVFVPTSPTPFTGWTILAPESDVIAVEMTVDEAVRFVVSCGVISPGQPATMPSPAAKRD